MSLTGLTTDTFYHYKTIVWRGASADTTDDRTFRTKNTTGTFTFTVIGDTRYTIDVFQPVMDSLFEQIRTENSDFVIITGDIIQITGEGVKTVKADTSWNVFHTHADSMFDSMMVVAVIGNHDMLGVGTQALVDSSIEAYNHAWVSYPALDSSYYWFRWGNCAFIISNTHWLCIPPARFGPTQLGWLTDVLCDSLPGETFNWRLMSFHLPIFGDQDLYWGSGGSYSYEKDSLMPMLDSASMDFVINGHHHCYNYIGVENGTHHIITAGGGANLHDNYGYDLLIHHYLLVNVYPDSLIYYVKGATGDTLATKRFYQWNKSVGAAKLGKVKL